MKTEQYLTVSRVRAFSFFEDPRNLFFITPDWLDFRLQRIQSFSPMVTEGSEFDYHINWLKLSIPWRSRIVNYRPPEEFTDAQIRGPFQTWQYLHRFDISMGGTRMTDEVYYCVPFSLLGTFVHKLFLDNQLMDIFCYRAVKIYQWAKE